MTTTTTPTYQISETGLRVQVLNVATTIVRLRGTRSNGLWQGIVSVLDVARVIAVFPITVEDVADAFDRLDVLGAVRRVESGRYMVVAR